MPLTNEIVKLDDGLVMSSDIPSHRRASVFEAIVVFIVLL